jgi:hypothetical protein
MEEKQIIERLIVFGQYPGAIPVEQLALVCSWLAKLNSPSNRLFSAFSFCALRVNDESFLALSRALLFPETSNMNLLDRVKLSVVYYHIASSKTLEFESNVGLWNYITGNSEIDLNVLIAACSPGLEINRFRLDTFAILGICKYFQDRTSKKLKVPYIQISKIQERLLANLWLCDNDELLYFTTEILSFHSFQFKKQDSVNLSVF